MPFRIGEAVAEFFGDNCFGLYGSEFFSLLQELAAQPAVYGGALKPFAPGLPPDILFVPERAAVTAPVCYTFHAVEGDAVDLVERYVFQSLRDFLYVELFKALRIGNAPRQCRLCKRWFFHPSSEKYMYCTRVVQGEEKRRAVRSARWRRSRTRLRRTSRGSSTSGRTKNTTRYPAFASWRNGSRRASSSA